MKLIGHQYLVISELGSGAYGTTFLVEDTRSPSRRRCVLKQLKPISNPEHYGFIIKRFEREAAVLERLGEGSNGQIPKLFAYFAEGGLCYIVQELINGCTLTSHLRERVRYSEPEVVEFLMSILPVLEFIHSQQIIHRDIKPDNIIIRENGKPVLIDFGIVKEVMNLDSVGNPTSSVVAGTPAFMPLEQAAGKPVFASDLYSIAMTAICMLTGKSPLQMMDRLTGDLSWRTHTEVSDKVAEVLEKATRLNFKERYLTAREMLDALTEAVSPAKQINRQQHSTVDISTRNTMPPPGPVLVDMSPNEFQRRALEERKKAEYLAKPRTDWTAIWMGLALLLLLVILGYGYRNRSPWMTLSYWTGSAQQSRQLSGKGSEVLKERETKNPPTALKIPYPEKAEESEKPLSSKVKGVDDEYNFPGGVSVAKQGGDGETEMSVQKMLERVVKEPVRVSEQYLFSKTLKRAEPVYPTYAALSNIGGKVVVDVVVDLDGSVIDAKAVSGHQVLWASATEAARKWRFQPKSSGELQVKVVGPITFNFDPKTAPINRSP